MSRRRGAGGGARVGGCGRRWGAGRGHELAEGGRSGHENSSTGKPALRGALLRSRFEVRVAPEWARRADGPRLAGARIHRCASPASPSSRLRPPPISPASRPSFWLPCSPATRAATKASTPFSRRSISLIRTPRSIASLNSSTTGTPPSAVSPAASPSPSTTFRCGSPTNFLKSPRWPTARSRPRATSRSPRARCPSPRRWACPPISRRAGAR
jgi:hypothetical protein